MKKQMTILAAAAILGTFAAGAIAATPVVTMSGGFAYAVEYDLLSRAWTNPADGVLNNAAAALTFSVATAGNPNLGTISVSNAWPGAAGATLSGTVKGFDVSLGAVSANWDGMSGNTGNPGATIGKAFGLASVKLATTSAQTAAAFAGSALVPAVAAVPGVADDGAGNLFSYDFGDVLLVTDIVIHPAKAAIAAVPAMPATDAVQDTVNGVRVAATLGSASVYGGLVLDPVWAGLGFVGATSKMGPATITAKAGKLLGAAGSATALFAKADIAAGANLKLLAKVAIAPAAYAYAHIDTAASGSGDVVDMEKVGWVATQADRNNGKANVYVAANLTVNPSVAPYASFDYAANGDYVAKAGTSFKTLFVNDAYVAFSAIGATNSTEFYAGLGKGVVSAFVGYQLVGALGQTKAEVKVTQPIDWLTTWASVGKTYAATTPYIKVGASAGASF